MRSTPWHNKKTLEISQGLTVKAKNIITLSSIFVASICNADPKFLDTSIAQILIADPEESFYENVSFGKDSLESFMKKKFSYEYIDSDGKSRTGYKLLFGGLHDTPIVNAVKPILEAKGMQLVTSNHIAYLGAPISIPSEQASDFIQGQAQFYRLSVETQGNPDELVSKATKRRFLGTAAALGLMLVGMNKLGPTTGSQITMGSGLSDSVYAALSKNRTAAIATDFTQVGIDFSTATAIQARTIKSGGGNTGQVLIAYKVPLTPEVENAALVEVIVALAGADRTPEQVVQARQADFDNKKLIWQKCVQEGRCTTQ